MEMLRESLDMSIPMWSVSFDFMGRRVRLGRKIPRFLKSSLCSSPAWIACFLQPFEISEEGRRAAQATGRTRVKAVPAGLSANPPAFQANLITGPTHKRVARPLRSLKK
jgi:hypothetical protein